MKWNQNWRLLLTFLACASTASAQNVSGYGTIPEPLLFLLREPAVHAELGLDSRQQQRLIEFNESFDGFLLASRNMNPEKARAKMADVMAQSRNFVRRSFSSRQQTRLRQITYRLRGLPAVLLPDVVSQLSLADQQRQEIEAVVNQTLEKIGEARTQTYQGEEAHQQAQRLVAAARKEEQETILGILDDQQRQRLRAIFGRTFDSSSLGKVSFKAPEFSEGDEWINSEALKLTDLRGKVVALHFWAFG